MNNPTFIHRAQAAILAYHKYSPKQNTPPCSPLLTPKQRAEIMAACHGLYYYYTPDTRSPLYFISDDTGTRKLNAGQVKEILTQRGISGTPTRKSENTMLDYCLLYLATIKRIHITK